MQTPSFDADELARYARQMRLPQLGQAGQQRLRDSSFLIVGAGGLGSPAATYLAAAGVGRIGIADDDRVDASNLHRQPIHGSSDVGAMKVASARAALRELNPHVTVEAIAERITSTNALELVRDYDIVIDASDNFPTRYLLNDACVIAHRPLVYGSVDRFEGQVSLFATDDGPCYRCIFPTPPPAGSVQNCADAGVLGVLPGLVGTMQAVEALKLALRLGDSLAGRLLLVDTLAMRFRAIAIERDPACPACGTRELVELVDYDAFCGAPTMAMSPRVATIDVGTLAELLKNDNSITLIDVREPYEWNVARLPTARLIPLATVPAAAGAGTIDRDADIVVYCHHGSRSEMAARFLLDAGFTRVRNLTGGIDRWSVEIDPRVPRY